MKNERDELFNIIHSVIVKDSDKKNRLWFSATAWHIVDKLISEGWHKDCPNNEEYKSLVEHHNAEVKDLECQVKDLEAKINDVYKKYSLWHKEAINMRMALQAISSGKIGRLACIDKARNALKGTD